MIEHGKYGILLAMAQFAAFMMRNISKVVPVALIVSCMRTCEMTTIVERGDNGGGAAMLIAALVIAAFVGLAIWFFSQNPNAAPSMNRDTVINVPAPSAPSIPTPAPSGGQ